MGGDWNREKTEAKVGSCGGAGSPWGGFAAGAVVDLPRNVSTSLLCSPARSASWGALDRSDIDQWAIIAARSRFLSVWQAVITRQTTNTALYMGRICVLAAIR